MTDLDRYLRRFWRLMAPPGRPGSAAVPEDRSQTISDEIGSVLEAVDVVQAEAERIRSDAERQAQQRRETARQEAERILADARSRAGEVRAEAEMLQRRHIETQTETALAAAHTEAESLRERVDRGVAALAAEIVERLLGPDAAGAER